MTEYDKLKINGEIPLFLKLIMVFIDRVGFPILAFIAIYWLSFSSISKTSEAIQRNTEALIEFSTCSKEFQHTVADSHSERDRKLNILLENCMERIRLKNGIYKKETE